MNENTTIREALREAKNNRHFVSELVESLVGVSLEDLIRGQKGVLNAESKPHEGTKASGRGAETIQRVEHDAG